MKKHADMPPAEIQTRLEGPVASVPTSFAADGTIDWDGVANIIEIALRAAAALSS